MSHSIEEAIEKVHAENFRINNLFEFPDGTWQANLTDGEKWYEFGRGANPVEAINQALAKRGQGVPPYKPKQVLSDEVQAEMTTKMESIFAGIK